jgi:single-strand DNA-binding protein
MLRGGKMYNRVILIGNLVTDIELKQLKDNQVGNFRIATNRKYGESEETFFGEVVVWGKLAENCSKYLSKGSRACIEGRLVTRTWESEQGKRSKIEIIAEKVIFLNQKGEKSGGKEVPPEEHTEQEPF